MYFLDCPNCGNRIQTPDVLRCPYCKKDMKPYSDELTSKHIRKCASYINPKLYSDRRPGRPSNQERREYFERLLQ